MKSLAAWGLTEGWRHGNRSPEVHTETLLSSLEVVLFTIPVTEIQEMRKIGGLSWKGKIVAGWVMGSKQTVDGLIIAGKEPKQMYRLTAMKRRNQLFDRLIAIHGQVLGSL